jgi:hypothetical protein
VGRHTIRTRATDAAGNVQPDVPPWNRLGTATTPSRSSTSTCTDRRADAYAVGIAVGMASPPALPRESASINRGQHEAAASRCQDPKPRLDQIYPIDRVMDATYRSLPSCRPWRCPDPRAGSATVPNCGARERAEGSVQRGSMRRAGARKPQSGAACPRPVSTEDRE